jgi:hypothetical protein
VSCRFRRSAGWRDIVVPPTSTWELKLKTLIAVVLAVTFAGASIYAVAEEKKAAAKPTKEQCKKDPMLKGCPTKKK